MIMKDEGGIYIMTRSELASHIDATQVQSNVTEKDLDYLIRQSVEYGFAAAFVLPCYMSGVKKGLDGTSVHTGGVVGFPSGGELTDTKLYEARQNIALGAEEIDMVINIGWLLSGKYDWVRDEIKAVKDITGEIPLKCIIEISLLPEDFAKRACELVVEGGGDYVKTATGWIAPTTLDQVNLIKSVVGDSVYIKAAGGIRCRQTALEFLEAGAYRLGISVENAVKILKE